MCLIIILLIDLNDAVNRAWNLTDPNISEGSNPDAFGETLLVLDNDWIAVSSRLNNCVYMYIRDEKSSSFLLNQTLRPESNFLGFGFSLHFVLTRALSKRILVVGAPSIMNQNFRKNQFSSYVDLCFSESGSENGFVYIYYLDKSWKDPTTPWILLTRLEGNHPLFGVSVASSYTGLLTIGSPYVNDDLCVGSVLIYDLNLLNKADIITPSINAILDGPDKGYNYTYGMSVALNSDGVVVGSGNSDFFVIIMIKNTSTTLNTSTSTFSSLSSFSNTSSSSLQDDGYNYVISILCDIQYVFLSSTSYPSSSGDDFFGSSIAVTLSGSAVFISQPSSSSSSSSYGNGVVFVARNCMKCKEEEEEGKGEEKNIKSCRYQALTETEGCPDVGCRFSSSLSYDSENGVLSVAADGGVYEMVDEDNRYYFSNVTTNGLFYRYKYELGYTRLKYVLGGGADSLSLIYIDWDADTFLAGVGRLKTTTAEAAANDSTNTSTISTTTTPSYVIIINIQFTSYVPYKKIMYSEEIIIFSLVGGYVLFFCLLCCIPRCIAKCVRRRRGEGGEGEEEDVGLLQHVPVD